MLDTNVVLKALIKDSVVRGILLGSTHEFLIPDHAIEETKRHLDVVAKKSGLAESEINAVIGMWPIWEAMHRGSLRLRLALHSHAERRESVKLLSSLGA